MIFEIQNTIVSSELIEEMFVCNIQKCKGQCCVDGNAGAPLEEKELQILKDIYPKVSHYIPEKNKKVIEIQGTHVIDDDDGEYQTPLIEEKECVYAIINERGIVECAIEKAYSDNKINWKKPISCHLYPIRLKVYKNFVGVNYNKWDICNDACLLGKQLKTPLYKFLKEPLIRRFGEEWYEELELISKHYPKYNQQNLSLD